MTPREIIEAIKALPPAEQDQVVQVVRALHLGTTVPGFAAVSGPAIDRRTKMRWGCVAVIVVGLVLVAFAVIQFFNSARMSGAPTAAPLQAAGIAKSIRLYAQDHNGEFPTSDSTSNEAFRKLFPDYMEGEKSFFIPNSAWHDAAPNKRPDGDIGSRPDFAQCLERGENHWAYVSGLDERSPPNTPLVADGFVEGQPGTYTDDPKKKGGVWKGTKAIVVFIDGSATAIPLSPKTAFRVLRDDPITHKAADIFTRNGDLPETARVLNPPSDQ
jgi:hypothetical protein